MERTNFKKPFTRRICPPCAGQNKTKHFADKGVKLHLADFYDEESLGHALIGISNILQMLADTKS